MEKKNEITIRGTLVSMRSTRYAVSILVATDAGTANAGRSFPLITFRDSRACNGLVPGNRITVKARMRTSARRAEDEKGKTRYYRQLVGTEIKLTDRILADYAAPDQKQAGGLPDDLNDGIVSGNVAHLYSPTENITILTLTVPGGDSTDRVNITCFRRQAHVARKFKEGDSVIAAVTVRTMDSADKVNDPDYQNLVCKDIIAAPEEGQQGTDRGKDEAGEQ